MLVPSPPSPPATPPTTTTTMPNKPCGTIAAYTRHQTDRTEPCPACKAAKARYDADRYLRRKARGETTARRPPVTMQDVAELIRRRQSLEKRLNVAPDVAQALRHAARQNGYL